MVNSEPMTDYRKILGRIRHRHLTCFMEIAHHGRVGLAAEALKISQPAVSKTLRELESALGSDLFRRNGKGGLTLTSAGTLFLRYAGASTAALREGLDALAHSSLQGSLTLKIGALPTVAARVMPLVVREFKKSHPVALKIITGPNNFLLEQLRLGDLDLVIGRLPVAEEMSGFSFSYLYSEEVKLLVRAGHAWPPGVKFDLNQLQKTTVLLPTRDSIIRPVVDTLLLANGIGALTDCIETVSPDFCRQYILHSDAVWIISEGVVEPDIQTGVLRTLDVDTSNTRGAVGLTIRADIEPSPMLRLLMNAIAGLTDKFVFTAEPGRV